MQKTLFIDIDGCIFKQSLGVRQQISQAEILPGVIGKFEEWNKKGYKIILTTGRKECIRETTEKQLLGYGLIWDKLIMDCGTGPRVLINDMKPDSEEIMASCFNLKRNSGLSECEI